MQKSEGSIKAINNEITQRIKGLEGTTVSREGALQPVKDYYAGIPEKTITPQKEQEIVKQYIEEVRSSQGNSDLNNFDQRLPVQQAQFFKQTLNKELNEYYARLAKGKIVNEQPVLMRTKAAMADGLRQQITEVFPEVKNLNQREASLIELNKSLGRAVNRIKNREIIPLAVQIWSGDVKGALNVLAVKALDHPWVKSQLAITLYHARGMAGMARAGAQAGMINAQQGGTSAPYPAAAHDYSLDQLGGP